MVQNSEAPGPSSAPAGAIHIQQQQQGTYTPIDIPEPSAFPKATSSLSISPINRIPQITQEENSTEEANQSRPKGYPQKYTEENLHFISPQNCQHEVD